MTTKTSITDSISAQNVLDNWDNIYSKENFFSLDQVIVDDDNNLISRESLGIGTMGQLETLFMDYAGRIQLADSNDQHFYSLREVFKEDAYEHFKEVASKH